MHAEAIKVPLGQSLLRHDETISGRVVAMTAISASLFAIHYVTPSGYLCDEKYAGTKPLADGLFEQRLMH